MNSLGTHISTKTKLTTSELSTYLLWCDASCQIQTRRADVVVLQYFPHYQHFVRRNHLSPCTKGQYCKALVFSLLAALISLKKKPNRVGEFRRHVAYRSRLRVIFPGTPSPGNIQGNLVDSSGVAHVTTQLFAYLRRVWIPFCYQG